MHTEEKCLSYTCNVGKISELTATVGQLGNICIVLSLVPEHR